MFWKNGIIEYSMHIYSLICCEFCVCILIPMANPPSIDCPSLWCFTFGFLSLFFFFCFFFGVAAHLNLIFIHHYVLENSDYECNVYLISFLFSFFLLRFSIIHSPIYSHTHTHTQFIHYYVNKFNLLQNFSGPSFFSLLRCCWFCVSFRCFIVFVFYQIWRIYFSFAWVVWVLFYAVSTSLYSYRSDTGSHTSWQLSHLFIPSIPHATLWKWFYSEIYWLLCGVCLVQFYSITFTPSFRMRISGLRNGHSHLMCVCVCTLKLCE